MRTGSWALGAVKKKKKKLQLNDHSSQLPESPRAPRAAPEALSRLVTSRQHGALTQPSDNRHTDPKAINCPRPPDASLSISWEDVVCPEGGDLQCTAASVLFVGLWGCSAGGSLAGLPGDPERLGFDLRFPLEHSSVLQLSLCD